MTAATHRIFIAVPLDPALSTAVADLEHRMESAGARLRWIKPENLHFTLRFLGHISTPQLTRAAAAAREAALGVTAFRVRLSGVGAFPSVRRPQVIWVGVRDGEEQLRGLAARLDDALARQRFPKEPRQFQAHLTLARARERGEWASLEPAIAALESAEVGEQDVASLVVMESLLRPSGAVYAPVEEVRLPPYEK